MRIVHAIGSIDPARGGPQTVILRMAAAQAALGHAVSVLSYADEDVLARARAAAHGVPSLDAVELRVVAPGGPLERLGAGRAARALAPLIAGGDFLHLHGVWEALVVRAAGMASTAGVPFCVRPAVLDAWSLRQKRLKKAVMLALVHRRMLDCAAFVQTLNADEARLIAPLGLRPPCVTVPNGVFLEEIGAHARPGAFRATVPGLGDRPFVLFLSRLHAKKGLDVLLAAFARLAPRRPDVHLVVAGPDDGAEADFRAALAAAGLGARVHLVGPVFGARKCQAMADAACFCLPSRQEGFSLAIVEALACGVPAVVSEACHFPEVAADGAGRVVPLDPDAIAHALLGVLADRAAAMAMGDAGRMLVARRFTWPRIAEETLAAYRRFGAGSRRAAPGGSPRPAVS